MMIMRTVNKNIPLEIQLDKPYLTFEDFTNIEKEIEGALVEDSQLILNFTQVKEGLQGDFYSRIVAKVQNFYSTEAKALDFLRNNLLLRYESKSSKAYEKLMQGYDLFFKVDFINQ